MLPESCTPEHVNYYSTARAVSQQGNKKKKNKWSLLGNSRHRFKQIKSTTITSFISCLLWENRSSSEDRHCHPVPTNTMCHQQHPEHIFSQLIYRKQQYPAKGIGSPLFILITPVLSHLCYLKDLHKYPKALCCWICEYAASGTLICEN